MLVVDAHPKTAAGYRSDPEISNLTRMVDEGIDAVFVWQLF
ncbi:hypothetical protein V1293_002011 [Bradyrhizobium sp. AZCC 1693]